MSISLIDSYHEEDGLDRFSSCKKLQDQGGVKILSMMQVDGVKGAKAF